MCMYMCLTKDSPALIDSVRFLLPSGVRHHIGDRDSEFPLQLNRLVSRAEFLLKTDSEYPREGWYPSFCTGLVRGLSNKVIKCHNKEAVPVQIAPILISQPRHQNQSISTLLPILATTVRKRERRGKGLSRTSGIAFGVLIVGKWTVFRWVGSPTFPISEIPYLKTARYPIWKQRDTLSEAMVSLRTVVTFVAWLISRTEFQIGYLARWAGHVDECATAEIRVEGEVSSAKEPFKREDILQKRPIILRSLVG